MTINFHRHRLGQFTAFSAAVLAWMLLELQNWAGPLATALTIPLLLVVPGFLIFRLIRRDDVPHEPAATLLYSVALSLLTVMLGGLVINTLWGWGLAIPNPLSREPLVCSFGPLLILLAATVNWRRGNIMQPVRWPRPSGRELALGAIASLVPILAIGGALTLNNGGRNTLSVVMLGLVCGLCLALVWLPGQTYRRTYPYVLYALALGILYSNSLRGWFITGHDVVQEYQVFQLTLQHSHWSMAYLRDAYNACLSITILPTILAKLTTIADPYIYKAVFQAIFALIAPLVYIIISRFSSRATAILAAVIFMSFPTFITDMTMLGRQEMAFLFFGLLVMTLTNVQLPPRMRSGLVFLLSLGMILSHYSTSYVALGIVVLAKGLETVASFYASRRRAHPARQTRSPLSWTITLAMLLTVYLWNSQITATSQGIASTIGGIATSLPKLLQRNTQTGVNKYSLVGTSLTDEAIFRQYTASIPATREFSAGDYYPQSLTNKYPVVAAGAAVDQPTRLGRWLARWFPVSLYNSYEAVRSLYAKLVQVAIVIGLGLMVWRRKRQAAPAQYLYLGFAALAVIALQVLLPSDIINYGLLRLIQQSLLLLAPAIIITFATGWKLIRLPDRWQPRMTMMVLIGFFAVNANLLPVLTGGYKPALSTANNGFYYEAYYTHADEIAGFQWLADHAPTGSVVFADEFARRKMITYAGIYARASLAPAAITKDSYVFLSDANITFDRVPFYYDGTLLYEQPPLDFLHATKNLIYRNGNVRIYK